MKIDSFFKKRNIMNFGMVLATSMMLVKPNWAAVGLFLFFCVCVKMIVDKSSELKELSTLEWLAVASLFLYPVISILSIVFTGPYQARDFDTISRFFLLPPVFLAIRLWNVNMKKFLIGTSLGVFFALIFALYQRYGLGIMRVGGNENPISFAQMVLILGFMSAFLPIFYKWDKKLAIMHVLLISIMAITAAALSQSRGPFLMLPIFAWLIFKAYGLSINWRYAAAFIIIIAIAIGVLLKQPNDVLRLNEGINDIEQIQAGNTQNSIGWRTEVWHAAIQLFKENPVFGVGKNRFTEVQKANQLRFGTSDEATKFHSHNDYLQILSEQGIFGAVVFFSFFYVIFKSIRLSSSTITERYVLAGVAIAWLVYGLTQTQMSHQKVTLFNFFVMSVLLGMLHHVNYFVSQKSYVKQESDI